jgi:hypothetical protein
MASRKEEKVMSWNGQTTFHNPISGETLIHRERADGVRDLKVVQTGLSGDRGSHAVLGQNGTPLYIREGNRTIADDRII